MATCEWVILSDYAFLDAGQKACLIGIFHQITVKSFPSVHGRCHASVRITGEPDSSVEMTLSVKEPDGEELGNLSATILLGKLGATELQLQLMQLPLPKEGKYTAAVSIDGALSRSVSFRVLASPETSK